MGLIRFRAIPDPRGSKILRTGEPDSAGAKAAPYKPIPLAATISKAFLTPTSSAKSEAPERKLTAAKRLVLEMAGAHLLAPCRRPSAYSWTKGLVPVLSLLLLLSSSAWSTRQLRSASRPLPFRGNSVPAVREALHNLTSTYAAAVATESVMLSTRKLKFGLSAVDRLLRPLPTSVPTSLRPTASASLRHQQKSPQGSHVRFTSCPSDLRDDFRAQYRVS